jgi:hypothetical protein
MKRDHDTMVGKLDRLGVERVARSQGLPDPLARHVADIVMSTDLREDRREEVFRELVAHFQDGLEAGRSADELLQAAGEPRRAARLIQDHKRLVTPESHGGSGVRDNILTACGATRGMPFGVSWRSPASPSPRSCRSRSASAPTPRCSRW